LLFIFITVVMLAILNVGRAVFCISGVLAFVAIFFDFVEVFGGKGKWVALSALSAYSLYVGLAVILMLRQIFTEKSVTGDTIKGGISIYILIGILWQFVYHLIWALNPSSFSMNVSGAVFPNFFYFSFTTITTLGYGDIVPLSYAAKTAAMLEAVVGQVYLGVFVARLVGLHIAKASTNR
jgi:hypothetical protein